MNTAKREKLMNFVIVLFVIATLIASQLIHLTVVTVACLGVDTPLVLYAIVRTAIRHETRSDKQ